MTCSSLRYFVSIASLGTRGHPSPLPRERASLASDPARGEGALPGCSPHNGSRRQHSEFSLHVSTKTVDDAFAGERYELHIAGLAGLKAHRGAGGDVEAHAAGFFPIEFQRRVGLEEMVVRADLDRAVAAIGDRERRGLAAGVEFDLAVLDEEFAGDHDWLLATLLSVMAGLVPAIHVFASSKKQDVDARHKA